uniref:Leucine-rich repeats and calponin homology (CH) domain containing 4 n=1 Tax=Cyprinodon variegatus TaxID=28743 RepID=A0A3Q2EGU9_CYPVA
PPASSYRQQQQAVLSALVHLLAHAPPTAGTAHTLRSPSAPPPAPSEPQIISSTCEEPPQFYFTEINARILFAFHRQDVSCNELQSLPPELGQLESLRDLNLRRNQLTTLPEGTERSRSLTCDPWELNAFRFPLQELNIIAPLIAIDLLIVDGGLISGSSHHVFLLHLEISELPLVRLDVSCNRISHVPLCYRHLRHLQTISLDSNPLQMPPAQICSKGKYHIFKYLNMEACKNHEELEKHLNLRPTGFKSW